MSVQARERDAATYEYLLPDHWILPEENIWTIMHNAYVGRVVELVRESGARIVLEVGCGDGWNCAQLAEHGLDVVGVDWSKNGIEHAKRLVPKGRFFCGDIREFEFSRLFPERFDAVILVEVLEHVPPKDCVEVLRSIQQVLKPGGRLVLTTPSTNVPNTNPQHYRHFDEKTLRGLVAEVDSMTIDRIEGYGNTALKKRYYRLAQWIDNRYFLIKPVRRWLQQRYAAACCNSPLSLCEGLIVSATHNA